MSSKVHGRDQVVLVLVEDGPPFFFWLQADEVFGVEESGVVGAVIGTAGLAGALGRFGKGAKDEAGLVGDADAFIGADALIQRAAHPERAFIQMRQELGADDAARMRGRRRESEPSTPIPRVIRGDGWPGDALPVAAA